MHMKHIYSFFFLLSLYFSLHSFAPGTLVKTCGGYTPIEQLSIGDEVLAYDTSTQQLLPKKITRASTHHAYHFVTIQTPQSTICTRLGQQFFQKPLKTSYTVNTWVSAQLIDAYFLYTMCKHIANKEVYITHNHPHLLPFYEITVADLHTFCITHEDIIVHNAGPL